MRFDVFFLIIFYAIIGTFLYKIAPPVSIYFLTMAASLNAKLIWGK